MSSRQIEVELKYCVSAFPELIRRLRDEFGVVPGEPVEESDLYFQHNERNFRQTDEALRLRRDDRGVTLTYKGPKLDTTTKTREEIEFGLISRNTNPDSENGTIWLDGINVLKRLGFSPAGEVQKIRRIAKFFWQGMPVTVTLDTLSELGDFVELETMVEEEPADSESDTSKSGASKNRCDRRESAKNALFELARRLDLGESIRTSYLELLESGRDKVRV